MLGPYRRTSSIVFGRDCRSNRSITVRVHHFDGRAATVRQGTPAAKLRESDAFSVSDILVSSVVTFSLGLGLCVKRPPVCWAMVWSLVSIERKEEGGGRRRELLGDCKPDCYFKQAAVLCHLALRSVQTGGVSQKSRYESGRAGRFRAKGVAQILSA